MKLCRRSSSESGVILLLTLFVILITYALVAQLTMGTAVSYQVAENSANRIRMRRAAMDVAGEELLRLLADDMPGGEAEEAAGAAADGLGDPSNFGDQGAAPGEEGEGEGEEEDDGSNSDSRNDDWWRPTRFPIGDMEVHGFVQDENGKFNILTVFHPDPEEREAARERFVRILDVLREDFDDDLTISDAERILDEFIVWVEGDLRSQKYPPAFRHSTQLLGQIATENQLAASTGEPTEESGESEQIVRELFLPYSLEELMLLESVEEDLYYDAIRPNDEIAPGLETVFTVYTSIDFDPPTDEELGSPEEGPNDLTDVSEEESTEETGDLTESSSLSDPIGGLDDVLEAPAALGIGINLNTCPPAVLYGLQPTSLFPTYFVDQILRYRNEVDEEALQEMEGEDREYDAIELARAIFREDDQTPYRYFRNLDDLTNLEGWEDRLEPEQREAFEQLIGVQSDVFSVYLWCRVPDPEWEQEDHYEEPPGAVLRLKAVVWRRQGEDGAKFVFLEPWHEVSRTRWHIPDFQDEIGVYREPEY